MNKNLRVNPWTSIWLKPRQTIRDLIQYNVNYRFLTICGLYGFLYILYMLLQTPYLEKAIELKNYSSIASVIIGSLILSIPVGYILINLTSIFLFLGGKIIKAKGTFKQIRAAFYWSIVPMILSLIILNILMIVFAKEFEMSHQTKIIPKAALPLMISFGLTQLFFSIWSIIITLKSLGEVQGFSTWMALLNYFFAFVIAIIILLLVFAALSIFR